MSDRNTGSGAEARSIHSTEDWRGSVAYNDGHATFQVGNVLEQVRDGDSRKEGDDLFMAIGNDVALMIYSGQ